MQAEQLKSLVEGNFEKLIAGGIRGVYPFEFSGIPAPKQQYRIDSPVVNNQLVFSPSTQIISFLIMELPSIMEASQKLFPKKSRNDGLKMIVSAHNEILNSASSKLAMVLARIDGKSDIVVTPPMVSNQAGDNGIPLNVSECLFWTFRFEKIAFDLIVTIQMI